MIHIKPLTVLNDNYKVNGAHLTSCNLPKHGSTIEAPPPKTHRTITAVSC